MYKHLEEKELDEKIAEYKKNIHELELELAQYLKEKQRRRDVEKENACQKYIGKAFKTKYRFHKLRFEDIIYITDVRETEALFIRVSPLEGVIERGHEVVFCAEPVGIAQDQSEENWMINTFFVEVPKKKFDKEMRRVERRIG